MTPGFILFFLVAAVDWLAIAKKWRRVEYFAKPGAMLVLLGLLALLGGFSPTPLVCFFLGLLFSLAGDVFLMISDARASERWFVPGLVAFLFAHIAYIIGLNTPLPNVSPLWSLGLAVVLGLSAARILRRIIDGVREKGLKPLVGPVLVYGTVITLMLLSAMLEVNNSAWKWSAAALVGLGAILFYSSDVVLAWNKFVHPVKNGPLANIILYHLGQAALVAGMLLQFGKG